MIIFKILPEYRPLKEVEVFQISVTGEILAQKGEVKNVISIVRNLRCELKCEALKGNNAVSYAKHQMRNIILNTAYISCVWYDLCIIGLSKTCKFSSFW